MSKRSPQLISLMPHPLSFLTRVPISDFHEYVDQVTFLDVEQRDMLQKGFLKWKASKNDRYEKFKADLKEAEDEYKKKKELQKQFPEGSCIGCGSESELYDCDICNEPICDIHRNWCPHCEEGSYCDDCRVEKGKKCLECNRYMDDYSETPEESEKSSDENEEPVKKKKKEESSNENEKTESNE